MATVETGITPNEIVSQLARSPHGKLSEYTEITKRAAAERPDFLAHLISWNRTKGQVRDSKVAIPVLSLSVPEFSDAELVDNSFAHLAIMNPRMLLKAVRFAFEVRPQGRMRAIRRLVESYLRRKEKNWPKWERTALRHRSAMKELYALMDIKPCEEANVVLFGRSLDKTPADPKPGSLFAILALLKDMSPLEAAGQIIENKFPFLTAMGAMGARAKDPDVLLALINRMTPTELVTNTAMLKRLGVEKNSALRAAYQEGIKKVSGSTANVLKSTRAAEAIEDDELSEKLRGAQEKQIEKLGGIEGDWLVLADRSGSMTQAIEIGRQVAAILAASVKGRVQLIFFDTHPTGHDVTGRSYEEIKEITRHVRPGGSTSIGCGLQWAIDAKLSFDGIVVISDGEENCAPAFSTTYRSFAEMVGTEVPVYFYRTHTSHEELSRSLTVRGIDFQLFEILPGLDYYSVANLVKTMRANRYALADEIMATPLLKLADVLPPA